MKITNLTTKIVTKRQENPPWNPRTVWHEKNSLLVFIETEEGFMGVGEAWCEGASPESLVMMFERDFKPSLIGQDALFPTKIWESNFQRMIVSAKHGMVLAALSAIDIAIWDILGKVARLPLFTLLGAASDKVFAYASGGLYGQGKGPRELAREMSEYVARGFRGVKLKVGGASLKGDIERVAAVREAVGPDVRVMVDAVYVLSVPEALKMSRALEPFDVYFFEAPVSPYDLQGLRKVNSQSSIPVAGNEFASGRWSFRDLIENDAVSYVHLDSILCGGIGEAMRIAAMAAARNLTCSFHSSSSAVCFAANLHVAAAISNCDSIEYHMIHQLLFDRIPEHTFVLEEGFIKLPKSPGLGLELSGL